MKLFKSYNHRESSFQISISTVKLMFKCSNEIVLSSCCSRQRDHSFQFSPFLPSRFFLFLHRLLLLTWLSLLKQEPNLMLYVFSAAKDMCVKSFAKKGNLGNACGQKTLTLSGVLQTNLTSATSQS